MSSASTSFGDPDRTARARIRDAAIRRFADEGIAGASIKAIAADAGVSAPLVMHHFGSKDGLRVACDEYVVAAVRARKHEAMAAGPGLDPFQAIRDAQQGPPLMRYLARTLVGNSPQVAALIDEMVEDAVAYTEEGVRSGLLKPSDQPRERVVVLVLWQLGALVLHDHVRRLLGADLTAGSEDPDAWAAWVLPSMDLLANGILAEGFYDKWREAASALRAQGGQRSTGTNERTRTAP